MALSHMERVTAALRAVALDKYASALEDEGYDDFDVLKKESETDRAQIAKDVGMTDDEAKRFVAMFDAAPVIATPLEPEKAVAKPPPPPKKPHNECCRWAKPRKKISPCQLTEHRIDK